MPEAILATAAAYAALADAQVGKPYVLGANGPTRFDCSGLVIWLNNQTGAFPMGDDTAAGLYNRTKAVTGSPAVGDLVFLRNNPARSNGIGHVAVLTQKLSNGDWRIIEARGRAYGVVRTTLSYWKTRKYFTGVRRLPAFKLASSTTPPPAPGKSIKIRVAGLNCLDPNIRQGDPVKLHPLTEDRKKALIKVTRSAHGDFYGLTEAPSKTRYALRDGMPGGRARWKVWERGAQAIMFDADRWAYTSSQPVDLHGYHGGVIATFTERATGIKVTVGVYHLPPNTLVHQDAQRGMLAEFLTEMRKRPGARIIIGDGMDDSGWAAGWDDVRVKAAASSTRNTPTYKGKSITDRAHSDSRTPIVWRGYNVLSAGVGSDHDLIVAAGTYTAASSL